MTPKELKEFVKVMKKEGILKLKTSDLEIELAHEALERKLSQNTSVQEIKEEPEFTEEQILTWSSHDPLEEQVHGENN